MRKLAFTALVALAACDQPETATQTEAKTEAAPAAPEAAPDPADLRVAVNESVAACVAEPVCMATLEADENLMSCPWYKAVGCSVVVAAALAACDVIGPECLELLEPVAKIGCCDCIPSGAVRDACKNI